MREQMSVSLLKLLLKAMYVDLINLFLVLLFTLCVSVIMFSFYCLLIMTIILFSRNIDYSILFRAGLVNVYYFNLFVLCKVFLSPSTKTDDLSGNNKTKLTSTTFKILSALLQDILAFRVSMEQSVVILICLPLYLTRVGIFFVIAFNTLSLF